MKKFKYLSGVSSLTLRISACIGCGMCEQVCPHQVIKVENKLAVIVEFDDCMECGACAQNCPTGALEVTPGVGCASYIIQTWIKGKDAQIECC